MPSSLPGEWRADGPAEGEGLSPKARLTRQIAKQLCMETENTLMSLKRRTLTTALQAFLTHMSHWTENLCGAHPSLKHLCLQNLPQVPHTNTRFFPLPLLCRHSSNARTCLTIPTYIYNRFICITNHFICIDCPIQPGGQAGFFSSL